MVPKLECCSILYGVVYELIRLPFGCWLGMILMQLACWYEAKVFIQFYWFLMQTNVLWGWCSLVQNQHFRVFLMWLGLTNAFYLAFLRRHFVFLMSRSTLSQSYQLFWLHFYDFFVAKWVDLFIGPEWLISYFFCSLESCSDYCGALRPAASLLIACWLWPHCRAG